MMYISSNGKNSSNPILLGSHIVILTRAFITTVFSGLLQQKFPDISRFSRLRFLKFPDVFHFFPAVFDGPRKLLSICTDKEISKNNESVESFPDQTQLP